MFTGVFQLTLVPVGNVTLASNTSSGVNLEPKETSKFVFAFGVVAWVSVPTFTGTLTKSFETSG